MGLLTSLMAQAQPTDEPKPMRYDLLAMMLALLALIGVVILWRKIQQKKTRSSSSRRSDSTLLADNVNELSSRLLRVENQLTNTRESTQRELKELRETVAQLTQTLARRTESRPVAASETQSPNSPAPVLPERDPEPMPSRPTPVAQSQRTMTSAPPPRLYARTADVPGGFSVGSLVQNPNRPMVFVITPTGSGQATFRITDDPEAQRLALSDPYSYLSDACNYLSRPEANSRIQMVSDGKLQLQGDKWHIIEKAEISFYA